MLLPVIRIMDMEELKENEARILSYDRILVQREYPKIQPETERQIYCAIIDEAVRLCRETYDRILNKQLVKCLLDNLQEQYPGVLDGLVPDRVGCYEVMEHLRNTVREKGSIRDLIHIMEEMERMYTASDKASVTCPSAV